MNVGENRSSALSVLTLTDGAVSLSGVGGGRRVTRLGEGLSGGGSG